MHMDIMNHSFRRLPRAMHCTLSKLHSYDNSARVEPCRWTALVKNYIVQVLKQVFEPSPVMDPDLLAAF
jgi:hypothetical protein